MTLVLATAVLTFEKVHDFLVLSERPSLWWASLYSRALTTICVDEVPTPPFPPDHRQAGERGAIKRVRANKSRNALVKEAFAA